MEQSQTNDGGNSLQAESLESIRDDRVLFTDLSFTLNSGEFVQIEGANGSGKTTLLKIICGLLLPESGNILWEGQDIARNRPDYNAEFAYMGHTHGLKEELTAAENLEFSQGLAGSQAGGISECMDKVGLAGYEYSFVRTFSAGQRRRLAMARLLVSDSRLWIMDEPFTALDKTGIKTFETLLDDHCENGGMAILSTHHPLTLNATAKSPIHLTP